MKKGFKIGATTLALLMAFGATGCGNKEVTDEEGKAWAEEHGYVLPNVKELPEARDYTKTGCDTEDLGTLYGAGCSGVSAENLHEYMNLDNVVYIDTRGSVASTKPGLYSEGHLKGFKNVEWFEYVHGDEEQLFYTDNGVFVPRYVDSVETLKDLFPQDKVLFIMCESGGRVANVMKLLDQYGWDMSKVYNVGGWGHYTANADKLETYADYLVFGTDDYKFAIKTGTANTEYYDVTVKVLLNEKDKTVGKVYITGGTYAGTDYKATFDAGAEELLNSFVGLDVDEIRAASANYAKNGSDVVTGATVSSTLVYNAVVKALEGIVIE